ncbi:RecT family recombinase [Janthinobacterium psychrotolerans]|uniref:RecT family protein n=1 Tax=Janthinobacterium psychrotolerans TaxID=1747903 RepID=A0A1A7C1B4_9BURK|nr:RecT family recombinase [Janthinobacterium psychrotolerans]OBV38103.1 RecT family protein [Janthinobacterium psychrotolerans]
MNAVTQESRTAMQATQYEQGDMPVVATSSASLILDSASMDSMMRLADIMAKGRATVPEHLRGNAADCAAVVMQAIQWRMNPFAVAQKTHLVNGTLGYEAQLVNAVIQSSGVTLDRFNYEWYGPWEKIIGKTKVITMPAKGDKKEYQFRVPDYGMQDEDGLGVRVSCTLKGETEPRVLELLLVQASVRNSPLWATDPKQQLAYLAVKRWTRLYAPDVILGVYTPDELEEVNREMRDITPTGEQVASAPAAPEASPGLIQEAKAAAARGVAAYQEFWSKAGAPNRKALAAYHDGWKADATAADRARTVDAEPAAGAAKPLSEHMQAILADFSALADEGLDIFNESWGRLSPATQDGLAAEYPKLKARAEAVKAAQ